MAKKSYYTEEETQYKAPEPPVLKPTLEKPVAKKELTPLQKAYATIAALRQKDFTEANVLSMKVLDDGKTMVIISTDGQKYRYDLTAGRLI